MHSTCQVGIFLCASMFVTFACVCQKARHNMIHSSFVWSVQSFPFCLSWTAVPKAVPAAAMHGYVKSS